MTGSVCNLAAVSGGWGGVQELYLTHAGRKLKLRHWV